MKIHTTRVKESIECRLPDGRTIEITMFSAEGEEFSIEDDMQQALRVLRACMHYFADS